MLTKNLEIYCDMDGVLANFEKEPNAVNRFNKEKGFFAKLEPISENVQALKNLIAKGYQVKILTASPTLQADNDKRKWLTSYLPEMKSENIIICRNTETKADFVKNIFNSLLIDDFSKNLIEWKQKGGQALKFVNDYDNETGTHTKYEIPFVKNLKDLL